MKITRFSLVALITLSFFSCQKKVNPFEIGIDHVGELTKTSTVKDLDKIYAMDSIVKHIAGDEFVVNANEIEIYDKQGKQLLILEATQEFDSTATIKSIRVIDPRFKTVKGFNTLSTFKELKDNYTISKITNTLSSVLVDINEINAYVAIDKKELPNQVQFDTKTKIEAVNIPDTAKIKYFWLSWE